jgi:hypothetical protein
VRRRPGARAAQRVAALLGGAALAACGIKAPPRPPLPRKPAAEAPPGPAPAAAAPACAQCTDGEATRPAPEGGR